MKKLLVKWLMPVVKWLMPEPKDIAKDIAKAVAKATADFVNSTGKQEAISTFMEKSKSFQDA